MAGRFKRPDAAQLRQFKRPGDKGRWGRLRPSVHGTDGSGLVTRDNPQQAPKMDDFRLDRLSDLRPTDRSPHPKTGSRRFGRGVLPLFCRARGAVQREKGRLKNLSSAHAFEVAFDGVRVSADCRLGEEGTGFKTAMKVLDNSRLDVAATSLGIAEAALAAAVQWAKDRQVGGEPLASKQGLQWMLADMKLRLEAAWGMTLQAVALRTAQQPFTLQSAMAKLYASEMVAFVTDTALQIHGGYGFTRDMPLERYARDARILRIYEGSSEIQRTIIARTLLA